MGLNMLLCFNLASLLIHVVLSFIISGFTGKTEPSLLEKYLRSFRSLLNYFLVFGIITMVVAFIAGPNTLSSPGEWSQFITSFAQGLFGAEGLIGFDINFSKIFKNSNKFF